MEHVNYIFILVDW